MHDASPQFDSSGLPARHPAGKSPAPSVVIHLSLVPGQTVSWRLTANAEICVHGSQVWMTRAFSPYDYWIGPSEVIRLARGERIWMSTDGEQPTKVTLTSDYNQQAGFWDRWARRWVTAALDMLSPRTL